MLRSAFLLLLTLSLPANGLDDLKGALGRLAAPGPLRGTYHLSIWAKYGMGKDVEETTGSASAALEVDAAGLVIRWDKALLQKAAEEAYQVKDKKAKATDSPSLGISAADGLAMANSLDYGPALRRLLAFGQLKQEGPALHDGKAARLLELQITPPRSEEDRKKTKELIDTAKLWLGADGLPVAAHFVHIIKAKVLMFTMERSREEEFLFALVGNRLVATRRELRETNHIMGTDSQSRTVATFTVR